MQIKKTKKTVTASTCDSVTLSDGTVIKNKEEAKKWLFYKIEQDTTDYGQPMWNKEDKEDLAKLESCFGKLGSEKVTSCNASKRFDVGARTADFIRRRLLDKGYTKDEVNSMGLKELREAADKENIKVVFNSTKASTSNYDEAQKHIKAAIDILAKCGKDDIIAKDNIANLSVVMFDLMGDKE